MNNKTFIIVTFILIAAAVIGFVCYMPSKSNSLPEANITNFPKAIGEWQGTDMVLTKRDYETLETKNLIMRDYKNTLTGDSVYLYIIYSTDNIKALHPPEICYTGGGATTITEKSVVPITDSIESNKFTVENKVSRQLVLYWFKSVNLYTYSYFKQQLKMATDRFFRKNTSGALIRVSTEIKDKKEEVAFGLLKSFCVQIEPLLAKYLP